MYPQLFNKLGRIASHGFVVAKVFPVNIVQSCIAGALLEHANISDELQDTCTFGLHIILSDEGGKIDFSVLGPAYMLTMAVTY